MHGLGTAAGRVTGGGAGADQVGELAARGVAGLGGGVRAPVPGDRLEDDVQAAEERGEPVRLRGRGMSPARRRPVVLRLLLRFSCPWVPSGCAAVR